MQDEKARSHEFVADEERLADTHIHTHTHTHTPHTHIEDEKARVRELVAEEERLAALEIGEDTSGEEGGGGGGEGDTPARSTTLGVQRFRCSD